MGLTWGQWPEDLDIHVTGMNKYSKTEICHIYYGDLNDCTGVSLDVDDVSSYGPETVTMDTSDIAAQDQIYGIYVYDYSRSATTLTDSGAYVSLYGPDPMQSAETLHAPL